MTNLGKWLFRFAVITDAHVADVEEIDSVALSRR